jgi:hypothetical protein
LVRDHRENDADDNANQRDDISDANDHAEKCLSKGGNQRPASSAKQRDAVPSASVFGDATAFASGNAFAAETLVGCWADFLLRDVRLALAFLAWSGGRGGCATLINAGATSRIRRWNRIAFAFGTWSSDGRAWFGLGIRRSCVGCVRDPDRQGKVGSGSD